MNTHVVPSYPRTESHVKHVATWYSGTWFTDHPEPDPGVLVMNLPSVNTLESWKIKGYEGRFVSYVSLAEHERYGILGSVNISVTVQHL